MSKSCNRLAWIAVCALVAVLPAGAQSPAEPPKPKPAPTVRLPIERLTPDATVAAAGVTSITPADGAVWLAADTLTKVAPKTDPKADPKAPARPVVVTLAGKACAAAGAGSGALWVPLCANVGLVRIDPKTAAVTATLTQGLAGPHGPVVFGAGSVWVIADARGSIARIDPADNRVVALVDTAPGVGALAAARDILWAVNATTGELLRIEAHTNLVTDTVKVGKSPVAVAVAEGAVWTLNAADRSVSRVDPATKKVTDTIALGVPVTAGQLASGAGAMWVSVPGTPVLRIDTRTKALTHAFAGTGGGVVTFADDALWVNATPATVWRVDPKRIDAVR